MTIPPTIANLLDIRTNDEETRQKGQLVQILILLLTGIGIGQTLVRAIIPLVGGESIQASSYILFLVEILLFLLICMGGLLLVRRGRATLAAHLCFIFLNFVFYLLLIQTGAVQTFPYFMLISIIAITTMASVRASMIYAIIVIFSVAVYYFVAKPSPNFVQDAIRFALITLSLSSIAWLTAGRMQKWLREATNLTQQLEQKADNLKHRSNQLQRSAAISQSTGAILNLDDLLKDIVYTIRDQFDYYFVAIYLLHQTENTLVLTEAVGAIGEELKSKKFQIKLESESVISWVAQNMQPHIILNTQNTPDYLGNPLLKETKSESAIPLVARGKLLGVLDIQSQQINAFLEEDIVTLQILANQLAINIDSAHLFAQAESYQAETQSLLNLNTLLTTTMDVGEIYRRAARIFSTQLNANLTLITDWNQENDVAVSQIMHIQEQKESHGSEFNLNPFAFPLAHFPSLSVVLNKQIALLIDKRDDAISEPEKNFLVEQNQKSCLLVPFTHGSSPIGIVMIFREEGQPEFTNSDMQLAKVMSNETAIALNNAMLASEAQGRVAQLSALNRLSSRLSLAPTLHDVFEGTRREVLSLFEATTMSVMLLAKDEEHYEWIYANEYGQELDLTDLAPIPITQGFTGHVIQTRRYFLINKDMTDKLKQFSSFSIGAAPAAWLGVPLIVASKIIGVLVVENEYDAQAFDERSIQLLETIGGSMAIAISNQLTLADIQAALHAQSEQRLQLETAAEISAATNSILDLNQLLEGSVSLIKERFSLYYAGIFLSDSVTNQAVLQAATGEAGEIQLARGHKLTIGGRSLIGGATGDGRSRITQDVTQDEEWQPNVNLPDTRSELALPLRVRGDIIGALTVQSTEPHAFTPELVSILQTMSDQLAIAIDNSRLLAAAESRVQRQRVLNQISNQLHNTADTDEIIRVGLSALSEQVNGRSVNIFLGKPFGQSEDKV